MSVQITGPKIVWTLGPVIITDTVITSWVIIALITGVCIWLTRDLKVKPQTKRQLVAEKLVSMVYNLIDSTMGTKWKNFAPYIAALFAFSFVCSMSGLVGVKAPTGDLSIVVAMALVTFVMIQFYGIRAKGVLGHCKKFLNPLNLISEVATPVSMTFRHFGNIAAGGVITTLLYAALAYLSTVVLKIIPLQFIQQIPILQVGVPAVLSIYFDVFTSFLQAYIISMLTMVFVSSANE